MSELGVQQSLRSEKRSCYIFNNGKNAIKTRKALYKSKFELFKDAWWVWFCQKKHKRTPLSGPIVKEKSIQLHYKLGGEETVEFTASEGWLWQWKATEYQIR